MSKIEATDETGAEHWKREYLAALSDLMRERQRSEQLKKTAINLSTRWILKTFDSTIKRLAEVDRAEDEQKQRT